MRLLEITIPKILYHGSPQPLKIGKAYRARHWKSADQGGVSAKIESILEKHRPANAIARNKTFYMVDNFTVDAMDLSGGNTSYVYAIQPVGRVERHDVQWINDIDSIMKKDDAFFADRKLPTSYSWHMQPIYKSEIPKTINMLAKNYWDGTQYPYKDWTLWEYLSPSFKVLKLIHEERD